VESSKHFNTSEDQNMKIIRDIPCPKYDVTLFSRKRYCASGLGLRLELGLGLRLGLELAEMVS